MKRSFKSLLSILTAAVMLLVVMPAAMAETTTKVLAPLNATITTFGEGVTVPEEGISVLTDDFFYSQYDSYITFTDDRDSNMRGAKLTDNTKKELVSFTSANSGIQWNFGDTPTIVKRIDLWILSYGGVGEYTVTAKNGSGDFEEITSGDLTPVWEGQTTETSTAIHAIYYPIVLPSEIEATEVKLTFNTFTGGVENQAYISEARIYDTNEINLGAQGLFEASNENKGWSPYLERYAMSATMVGTTYNPSTTAFVHSGNNRVMWPSENKAVYIRESSPSNTLEGGKGRAWYATSLGMSKAKINRLTVNMNGGNITGLEVYSRPSHDANDYYRGIGTTASIFPLDSGQWTQVASFSCNITKKSSEDDRTFEIPNAIASADIFIEFEYATGSKAEIMSIDMYALADYELTPYIKDTQLTGTPQAGETLTFSADSLNNKDAKVFFAIYEGATLIHVGVKDLALSSIKGVGSVSYSIPATVTGNNLSAKAFLWDGATLVPLLTAPVEQ